MDALVEIANKAVADYGFRQTVLWSPDEIISRWELSAREAEFLSGPLREALEDLPIPVEPQDAPGEQRRIARLIRDALGMR